MSFFAGRISGKTVLSLNSASGGSPNDHINPNTNTIFHSDMPYVIITGEYSVALGYAGENYWVAPMPSNIQATLSSDRGAVVLTVVKFTDGSSTMLYGSSISRGIAGNTITSGVPLTAGAMQGYTSRYSGHIALHAGTYTYNNSNHVYSIEESGTGITVCHVNAVALGAPPDPVLTRVLDQLYGGLGYVAGTSLAVPVNTSGPYVDPNWNAPLGPYGNAHTWFFVSNSSIRNGCTYNNTDAVGTVLYSPGGNIRAVRVSLTKMIAAPGVNVNSVTSTNLGKTPASVTWYTTNLRFNGSTFTATNLFTGNDILISKSSFIIKGTQVNNNANIKFINQVASGNLSNRADMLFVGTNVYKGSPSIGTNGVSAYSTSNNGAISVAGSASGGCQVSIYNFSGNKSWTVDTRNNSISTEYGQVWGPSNIPLKVVAGNTATVTYGNDNNAIIIGNGYTAIQTLGLGIPATSTVAVAIVLDGTSVSTAHGIVNNNNSGTTYQIQRRNRSAYSYTDNTQFAILTLPTNVYVPFLSVSSLIHWELNSGSPNNMSMGAEFYLKNLGNGNVEVGVYKNQSQTTSDILFVPQTTITIQRLT